MTRGDTADGVSVWPVEPSGEATRPRKLSCSMKPSLASQPLFELASYKGNLPTCLILSPKSEGLVCAWNLQLMRHGCHLEKSGGCQEASHL
jgi:hypothetical protein